MDHVLRVCMSCTLHMSCVVKFLLCLRQLSCCEISVVKFLLYGLCIVHLIDFCCDNYICAYAQDKTPAYLAFVDVLETPKVLAFRDLGSTAPRIHRKVSVWVNTAAFRRLYTYLKRQRVWRFET